MALGSVLLVLLSTLLNAAAQYLLKEGAISFSISFSQLSNYNLIFGIFLYAVSFGLLILAMQREELSIIYPLMSLSYVWVLAISIFAFREPVSNTNILGTCFIMVGSVIVGWKR